MSEVVLREMSVGELLDKAFRIYRKKFPFLIGIMAVVLVPESLVRLLVILYIPPTLLQLNTLISSFFQQFAALAMVVCISQTYLGKQISLGNAYSRGLKRFWSVFGANFVVGFAIVTPLLCVLVSGMFGGVGFYIAIFAWAPFAIYLSTRWSLSTPAILNENVGGSEGLKHSWNLTQGFFWRVFGTSFAAGLLTLLITSLPTYFFDYVFNLAGLPFQTIQMFNLLIEQIATLIATPFSIAVTVLIYYDLRVRKEGFDLQVLAETTTA